ncbi:Peptidoglycan glycosyltransferase FtsW [Stratiformator vulcanicus]|uniref:Probable peptidoglycan glycosyltransferase FtsW n=2 Tax=Stratiformator vulcanicus TaxID=2527980 RepID=A0A517R2A6_9PLAN|nr:Peptidoglycan glycosyltransferase FtsW [Stratiformator vulcanicus]
MICAAAILVAGGMLFVQSASITSRPTDREEAYLWRHAAQFCIGLVGGVAAALLPPKWWFRLSPFAFAAVAVLLLLVLVPGIGTEVNAARRWFRFAGVSLQPSELAKLVLPLMTAFLIAQRSRMKVPQLLRGPLLMVPAGVLIPLVFLEPDLGTSLFLAIGLAVLIFAAGAPLWRFALFGSAVIPAAIALAMLRPYQWERITGFLKAWADPQSAPYQLRQSLITLGSGGWTGTGLGRGWQKLSFLPEPNTDFVFAVLGEELGLVGTLGLIATWMVLFVSGLKLLSRPGIGRFRRLVGVTLLCQLALQATINAGVATALLPSKGIPHPFLSYGGSNLVVSLTALGMIVSMAGLERVKTTRSEDAELSAEPEMLTGPHWQRVAIPAHSGVGR